MCVEKACEHKRSESESDEFNIIQSEGEETYPSAF